MVFAAGLSVVGKRKSLTTAVNRNPITCLCPVTVLTELPRLSNRDFDWYVQPHCALELL